VTETIYIGPQVSYVGDQAFAGFPRRRFEVSEENIAFSEKSGSLLNKAGDAIFEFSSEVIKVFVVPEGCVCVDLSILEQYGNYDRFDNDDPLEVYLPDSVIRFTGSTIFAEDTIMHCHEGSRAEKLAEEYGVKHLPSDFKKKNGYLRSIELSKQYDLYRQDYCGCIFSKAERMRQKREAETATEA
jgi:hypothetical protein